MIELIRNASTLQFILGVIALCAGIMILLQATINRAVWSPYVVAFLGALVGLAVTLR